MPENLAVRRLYLSALLELSAHEAGLDQPLATGPGTPHDMAAELGTDALEQVLAHSTTTGHVAAAAAAVQILGEIGSPELLHNRGPRPTLLVDATMHADRRLRYAAVAAIMNLKPERVYPGSSRVVSALVYFAGSAGERRALVLDTHLQEATRLASLLMEMGFDQADVTTQGRDFLERAVAWPDYELALVDFNLPRTNLDELVQMLRHDHRGRTLPLVFVASSAEDQRAARYVADHLAHVGVMVRPLDRAGMEVQVNSFLAKAGTKPLPAELRLKQAQQAVQWLAQMAAAEAPLYNVQRAAKVAEAALTVPELAPQAAMLLADLGTAGSQPALVGLASRGNLPLELRKAAAQAFRHSVHRHGILLTSGEMLRQYDRYNASELEPVESQEVLSSILDTLEAGRRQ
jgi:CheY-like chemotaxis protein